MQPEGVQKSTSALESTTFQATIAFLLLHGAFAWLGTPIPTELTMAAIVAFAGKEAAGKLRRAP
ncbi:MAG: hypothetical protein K8S98_16560 [Planctomycetes bacterium]|nr:hypothetical protein [Planctomycetota bacterium]